MAMGRKNTFARAQPEDANEVLAAMRDLARDRARWLLIGSIFVRTGEDSVANRSYLLAPDGGVAATYDKIHMFDVDLEGGESYRESNVFAPGDAAVAADTPCGRLGLTVCYDVRFPALYRALAKSGAEVLTVPAAFTRKTGQAHWHVLLRARAIETGCWVLAPAQCGDHEDGRETYGHALIVDPWGEVVADAGETPGVIMAEIDTARVAKARGMIPSLWNDRPFAAPPAADDAASVDEQPARKRSGA
jgi:predicted amidohydrolase